ncbi:hypothetical protein LEMLEM_LOCUS21256 [Lemmus lemmus]
MDPKFSRGNGWRLCKTGAPSEQLHSSSKYTDLNSNPYACHLYQRQTPSFP